MQVLLIVLLILAWVILSTIHVNYTVSALVLAIMVMFVGCVIIKSVVLSKSLAMMVYLSGAVVFILYVSCTCVDTANFGPGPSSLVILVLVLEFVDKGVVPGLDSFWGSDSVYISLLVAWSFNLLVMVYMSGLFKISGSLRFQIL